MYAALAVQICGEGAMDEILEIMLEENGDILEYLNLFGCGLFDTNN